MPSFFEIVAHTPLWVWPILLFVLALGIYGLRPRVVPPWRLAILPLVGLGMSLSAIVQSPRSVLTSGGWLIGLLLALPAGHLLGRRREAKWLEGGRLEIAGGAFMLAFGLSIFAARYALGVLFGVLPELKAESLWIVLSGGVGGAIAGIGLGWLAGLLVRRPTPWLRRARYAVAAVPLVVAAGLGAMIAFNSPVPGPRLAAADTLPGSERWNWAALPEVRRVTARDGAPLTYRLYAGPADRAIVLVHGSSAASTSMHRIAEELQKAGATVYSISLRGHGGSGAANGDTSYKAQLDDDLADFVRAVSLTEPKVHRTLMGFSSGGGLVLREASGPNRTLFDAYLAISPYIGQDSPTERPAAGGWASVAVARVVALSILDGFGLPLFQGLPVVHFATPAGPSDTRTPVYSFRLMAGMQLGRDWRHRIESIERPTGVIIGAKDELFRADRFQPLFAELNPRIAVSVVPDARHMDMITNDAALAAVVASWHRLAGARGVGQRFDFKVREDMFAGVDGDREAFDRAMTLIADTLAADPDHAEALVWRGDGRLFLSGQAFLRGAIGEGQALAVQGLADMDRAVALAPKSIAVRIPRAAGLMPFARGLRPFNRAEADRLTKIAVGDFEFTVAATAGNWSTLAEHNRGELLGALADGWLELGDAAKANVYLDRLSAELPGTPYAKNAALRRIDPAAKAPLTCLGCH